VVLQGMWDVVRFNKLQGAVFYFVTTCMCVCVCVSDGATWRLLPHQCSVVTAAMTTHYVNELHTCQLSLIACGGGKEGRRGASAPGGTVQGAAFGGAKIWI